MNSRARLFKVGWICNLTFHSGEMKCCVTAGGAAPLKEDGTERGLSLDPLLWRIGFGLLVYCVLYPSTSPVRLYWTFVPYSCTILETSLQNTRSLDPLLWRIGFGLLYCCTVLKWIVCFTLVLIQYRCTSTLLLVRTVLWKKACKARRCSSSGQYIHYCDGSDLASCTVLQYSWFEHLVHLLYTLELVLHYGSKLARHWRCYRSSH